MGLFSVPTVADGVVLEANAVWNDDHQTIIDHTEPFSENSFEATVAQMNLETNPAPLGVVSLPAAMSDELQRLRYSLSLLKGLISSGTLPPHWWSSIASFSGVVGLPVVAIRREITVAYPIPSGVPTNLSYDTTIYNTGNFTASLVVPVTGIYLVGAMMAFGDGSTTGPSGNYKLSLNRVVGATATEIGADQCDSGALSGPKALCPQTIEHFDAGNALRVIALQTSGSSKDMLTTATARPAVWMSLLGC